MDQSAYMKRQSTKTSLHYVLSRVSIQRYQSYLNVV